MTTSNSSNALPLGVFNLDNLGPISPSSVSFPSIFDDLKQFALAQPDGESWVDWQESSTGTIVAQWIAGLGTFRAVHEITRLRESSLDLAQLTSQVFELAFNKGMLVPPSLTMEITLSLMIPAQRAVASGDMVGSMGAYELYSLEDKTIQANVATTLVCAVGHLQNFVTDTSALKPMQALRYLSADTYFAQQLERFSVGTDVIPCVSDATYLSDTHNDFVLRRVMPSQARIYVGNGTLGWYKPNQPQAQYRVLTYSDDLAGYAASFYTPRLLITGNVLSATITLLPSFEPGKETVREAARVYPVDGRIVTDSDYSVVLRKNFGGVLSDVYSYNTDPVQQVHFIMQPNFGAVGSDSYNRRLVDIAKLVDSKRAMGMSVVYTAHAPADGLVFVINLRTPRDSYSTGLVTKINNYLATRVLTFYRNSATLTSTTYAVDLSARFGVRLFPTDSASIVLTPTSFFRSLSITLSAFDPKDVAGDV